MSTFWIKIIWSRHNHWVSVSSLFAVSLYSVLICSGRIVFWFTHNVSSFLVPMFVDLYFVHFYANITVPMQKYTNTIHIGIYHDCVMRLKNAKIQVNCLQLLVNSPCSCITLFRHILAGDGVNRTGSVCHYFYMYLCVNGSDRPIGLAWESTQELANCTAYSKKWLSCLGVDEQSYCNYQVYINFMDV